MGPLHSTITKPHTDTTTDKNNNTCTAGRMCNGASRICVTVMTTIAAFAPLLFIKGQIGDFMRVLPIVVLAALTVSLMEALVILPAHLAHIKTGPKVTNLTGWRRVLRRLAEAPDRLMQGKLVDFYERLLRVALKWRYITLSLAFSTVVLSSWLPFPAPTPH